jgi:26S proteasome regulatory subunit N5
MSKKGVVVDCSGEVNDGIPKWTRVALEEKRLPEAVDGLLVLEKKCRNGEDHESGQKVAACIVELCYKMKDYEALKANLVLLSKRRGQV